MAESDGRDGVPAGETMTAPKGKKRKSVTAYAYLYAWKWPDEKYRYVRSFLDKRAAQFDRRFSIREGHECGPIVRVEVPL